MAIRVDTSISIRSEFGVTLGQLLKVSDKQLLVAADRKFRPGTQVEFQLELPAYGATIYGLAQITRVTAVADGPSRFVMAITQLPAKDRSLFQQWIYELAQQGGTPAGSSAVVSSIVSTMAERRVAPRSHPGAARPVPQQRRGPDPRWSAASEASDARQNVGRAAVREALRARFAGKAQASKAIPPAPEEGSDSVGRYGLDSSTISQAAGSTPRPSEPPPRSAEAAAEFSSKIHSVRSSRTAGGGEITVTHSPEAEQQFSGRQPTQESSAVQPSTSAVPRPKRVEVQLVLDSEPPLVALRYRDQARFLADYTDYLSKNAAFVRWAGVKPGHRAAMSVQIELPGGAQIACDGQVVAIMPSGFGLSLQLSDQDREQITAAARVQG